ncbi:hypothetical protein [Nitrosospira briensis]|uniref:hypothetical protein n=1 Tax=Nitrosospira briensis TaxID=35799 RepID=UPI00210E7E62|nr:hypothetical protein [Nitrosospira briensis]
MAHAEDVRRRPGSSCSGASSIYGIGASFALEKIKVVHALITLLLYFAGSDSCFAIYDCLSARSFDDSCYYRSASATTDDCAGSRRTCDASAEDAYDAGADCTRANRTWISAR